LWKKKKPGRMSEHDSDNDFEDDPAVSRILRDRMYSRLKDTGNIQCYRVLQLLRATPREAFAPPGTPLTQLYSDAATPPFLSSPFLDAWRLDQLLQALAPTTCVFAGQDSTQYVKRHFTGSVLVVGFGSLYFPTMLGQLFPHAQIKVLGDKAERHAKNIEVRTSVDWARGAPFDAIVSDSVQTHVPETWKRGLRLGGLILSPEGPKGAQAMVLLRRTGPNAFTHEEKFAVAL
jgi:protein-L-isoaspartate O-methyltransferase